MVKFFVVFILAFLILIYRQAIFGDKIVLSSNFLASFYSPWSTEKFPGWEQGIPNKPIGADMFRFFYPNRTFTNSEIAAGRVPLWNPYIFSGNVHLADFQSAIFYPLNALYLLLPQLSAWSILVIIQPFLATIFTYLFLSTLPIKRVAAMFGAFAFGFSGFVVTWSQEAMAVGHSVIWLPLILFGLEKKKYWLAAVALTFSILSGYLQTTVYVSALVFIYALFKKLELKKTILIFVLAAGLSAIQILPSLEAFNLSARPQASIEKVFDTYLLSPLHLVKLIAPDINGNPGTYNYFGVGSYNETVLYIGVVPLVFAILAMWKKRNEKTAKFFLTTGTISFLLTTNFFLTKWFLHLPFPLIPTFQPSRILVLTTFCLAVLSAYGLSAWLDNRKLAKNVVFICIGLTVFLLVVLGYFKFIYWPPSFTVAAKNSILPLVFLSILLLFRKSVVAVLLLTIVGQFYFFSKYLVLGDKQFFYPNHPVFEASRTDRFVALDKPILGDFATFYRAYSPEGYDPIFSQRYGQLLYAGRDFVDGKLAQNIPRIEVTMSQVAMNPQKLERLLTLLGVKNIFRFEGSWQNQELINALPRVFLAGNFVVENNPQKILDKIFDPNFDLRKTVILEEEILNSQNPSQGFGIASFIKYDPTDITVETSADKPKILFLSDNYYPGWKAKVDGKPTKIYRADFSFRAVGVPAGKHIVKFTYEPLSFRLGAYITLATLFLIGGGQLLSFRNRH